MNLKIASLIINDLRILRFQGFKARTLVGRILTLTLSPGEREQRLNDAGLLKIKLPAAALWLSGERTRRTA